jgi:hypothetical protein
VTSPLRLKNATTHGTRGPLTTVPTSFCSSHRATKPIPVTFIPVGESTNVAPSRAELLPTTRSEYTFGTLSKKHVTAERSGRGEEPQRGDSDAHLRVADITEFGVQRAAREDLSEAPWLSPVACLTNHFATPGGRGNAKQAPSQNPLDRFALFSMSVAGLSTTNVKQPIYRDAPHLDGYVKSGKA